MPVEPSEDFRNGKALKPYFQDLSRTIYACLQLLSETVSLPKGKAQTQLPFPSCMYQVECKTEMYNIGEKSWV
jgi:hypothetical protein